MWSRDQWTQDWYLDARWAWLGLSVALTIGSAVDDYATGIALGLLLVGYSLVLLRVTYVRCSARTEASGRS
jgi:hypothetical protein